MPTDVNKWTGKWCWSRVHLPQPWNSYYLYRRTVELPGEPRRAAVRVSADARYTLYVNGQRVHQGPARCFPETQSYDELDIGDYLAPGRNAICAIVHQFGVPTFFSVYRDAYGFVLDGAIEHDGAGGGTIPIHTPTDWLCRPARGWRKDVVRLTIQLGFQEHFDADADPADWLSPTYEATEADGWLALKHSAPVGSHPWLYPEPRGIPLIAQHEHDLAAIVAQFRGKNARGYKVADDVYHLPLADEERKRDGELLQNPEAMLRRDNEVTTITPPGDGEFVAVVLDLGQYRTGHLQLDIADAAGDEIIDIIYAEDLDKAKFPLIVGRSQVDATNSHICTADRYRCRPGAQRWEPFWYKGMKNVALVFRNVERPLRIRHVGVRQVHAAVEDAGEFECSDERLNQIWRVGRETQRNCLFDAFVDCPWREQAMWWGDARVQSRVTAHAFGDISILERGIRLMARSQASDGSLGSHPPSDAPFHRLPDFMMTWVGSLWDYYFHTGRTELLRECLPVMHRVFDFLKRHELADGLIGTFEGWWVFLDWQSLFRGNYSSVLNLMYLQALRYAAAVCELVREDKAATDYAWRAQALTGAITKYFWDDAAKHWRDGFDVTTNQPVEQTSQHANTLALLLGLKPEHRDRIAREFLLKPARQRKGKVLTASPFFYAYVLEALFEAGLRTEGIDIIRDKWGGMIDAGATTFWELWEVTTESRCHAWSASPVYHLMQQILGVTPTEPGWRGIRIAPLVEGLDYAKGIVPSPLGKIRVEWEKAGDDQLAVRVDVPAEIEAEFVSPLGESRALRSGLNEFNT